MFIVPLDCIIDFMADVVRTVDLDIVDDYVVIISEFDGIYSFSLVRSGD